MPPWQIGQVMLESWPLGAEGCGLAAYAPAMQVPDREPSSPRRRVNSKII
jgi:hypothetical protein